MPGAFTDQEAANLKSNVDQLIDPLANIAAAAIGSKMVGIAIVVIGHDPDRADDAEGMGVYSIFRVGSRYGLPDSSIVGAAAYEFMNRSTELQEAEQ